MKKKIIGVTVGTPTSPKKIEEEIKPIKTVNGKKPDENGNVEVVVDNSMLITFTMSEEGEVFADKTIQECLKVYNKGGEVKAILNGLDERYKGRLEFVESYEDEPSQIASVVFMLDSILDFTNKIKVFATADDDFEYFYHQKKTLVAGDELPAYKYTAAKVGQVLTVASVDENGVPTEWETIDIPTPTDWGEPIAELVLEEEVNQVDVPYEGTYKELLVNYIPAFSSTATSEREAGQAWIGTAFGGGNSILVKGLSTNYRVFPSWFHVQNLPVRSAEGAPHTLFYTYYDNGTVQHSYKPWGVDIGRVGFRADTNKLLGVGTTIKIWGRGRIE